MWMADPHVISALREKRALVSGLIEKLERKLEQHRADLTHTLTASCGCSSPTATPEISSRSVSITAALGTLPGTSYRGSRWTRYGAQTARCKRRTRSPVGWIDAKGFDTADAALRGSIRDQVLTLLRSFRKQHVRPEHASNTRSNKSASGVECGGN
jgi:hypothetical protein